MPLRFGKCFRGAAALAALFAVSPAVAQRALSNFPLQVEGGVRGAAALADLDGDGRLDVVVGAGAYLTAVGDDGQVLAGFPVPLGGEAVGDAAAADVDGDGRAEALAVTEDGQVWLVRGDGTPLPGYPVVLRGGARAGGALLDVDGDGRLEVVVGGNDGSLHAFRTDAPGRARGAERPAGGKSPARPREARGFPVKIGADLTSPPAFADLGAAGAPSPSLLVGAADGGLHVVGCDGRPRPGFPVLARYLVTGSPSVADLDDDGLFDVVFTSQDYRVYAVGGTGKLLPGFPVETGYRIYGGAALADLNDDGLPEIVFASADRRLYAVDARGRALPGFPVDLGEKSEGAPVAADVDRDGRIDLVVATVDGRLHVVGPDGKPLKGWPVSVGGRVTASVTVADFVGDGFAEIVVGTLEGGLTAFKSNVRGPAPAAWVWPTPGHDAARTGRLHPNPSRFQDLAVEPARPISTEALAAHWTHVDLDREPEGEVELRWLRDGKDVPSLAGRREVPAAETHKRERWRFTVRSARDGAAARTFTSPEVTIRNAVPGPPGVALEPAEPTTGAALKAKIARAGEDPDADPLVYHYAWFEDGKAADLPETADTVPGDRIHKGARWRVAVRAFDGEAESVTAEAETRVRNSAPSALAVALEPARPTVTDALAVHVTKKPTDIDGDALVEHHRWRVRGADAGIALASDRLPAGLARKGDEVTVGVRAFDGDAEGPEATLRVVVANTPPSSPVVAIDPARPTTGRDLVARIETASRDADEDPVHYRFSWKVDGAPAGLEAERVPGARVHAGQRWEVEVVAADGEADGGHASARVEVADTPPSPPVIAATPADPLPGEALEARVLRPASDPDGDPVELRWAWSRGGGAPIDGPSVPAGRIRKGERWTVTATPHARGVDGTPVRTEVVVGNTPPPPPTVTLDPASPLGAQALKAEVGLPKDPDGDRIVIETRWLLDGRPVTDLDDAVEVPAARVKRDQVWTVRVRAGDGESWSRAVHATATVGDRPPEPPRLAVSPERPRTTDALECRVTREARDPDGDPLDVEIRWERGGAPTGYLGRTLSADATRKHERWRCVATVRAGGARVDGAPSSEVEVANTPPAAPAVTIEPAVPHTGEALRCAAGEAPADVDGDRSSWRYAWTLDGRRVADLTGADVPGARVHKGQAWTCEVVPNDGEVDGPAARARTEVRNSPPTAPVVRVVPGTPRDGDELRCEILEKASDPDGDRITYGFKWYLGEEPQPFAPTSVAVRGRLVEAGQHWRCGVVAGDGVDTGPEGRSKEVDVGPAAPQLAAGARR